MPEGCAPSDQRGHAEGAAGSNLVEGERMGIWVVFIAAFLASCSTTSPEKWARIDGRPAHEETVKVAIGNCQEQKGDTPLEECMKRWGYRPATE